MAGLRVELLLLLLLVVVLTAQEWETISETQLLDRYNGGPWSDPVSVKEPDNDDYDTSYDDDDDAGVPEKSTVELEDDDDATSPFADYKFEVDTGDFGPRILDNDQENDYGVEYIHAPLSSWTGSVHPISRDLYVDCRDTGFHITLQTDQFSEVKVLGSKKDMSVLDAEKSCGFEVNTNTITVPFSGCNVQQHDDGYSLQLQVDDLWQTFNITCKKNADLDPGLYPRGARPTCPGRTSAQPSSSPNTPQSEPIKARNCAVAMGERVTCGYIGISISECEGMGCCFHSSSCYYPLDECTADQHFVFAIRHDSASIPVDPTKLVIPGHAGCKPVILNNKVAIFKFRVTECGTRVYQVGGVKIYLAEVQTKIQALNLKYGLITRSNPLRFLVECRYSRLGGAQQSLATVGYMVKIPASTLPSALSSNGLYSVELRIATDQTYKSFHPTYHQPLKLLLGKPVYLELRLKSPKPDAVILVNYCLAYPRSAKNALVLIYEGCANPHDPNVSILQVSGSPKNRNQRRFTVKAFQFMEQTTNKYLNEEICFMCSAEVCMPTEKTCEERCFDGKAP